MPASSECNWQVKLKILKKGTRGNSSKARSVPIGTSVCLSKGEVHVQILQDRGGEEEGGRRSFNCTTSVLVGKSLVWNGHSGWHHSSTLSFSSAELVARGWEKSLSGHVWGECRGARKAPVFLRSDLCQGIWGRQGSLLWWKLLL